MSNQIIIEDIRDDYIINDKIEGLKTTNEEIEVFKLKQEINRLFNLVEQLREEKLQLIMENAKLKLNDK